MKPLPFILVILLAVQSGVAVTRTVTTLNDGGPGSLREALLIPFSGDVITFAAGLSGTISLESSLHGINADLTILSPNVQSVTIDGNSSNRIFQILNGNTVTISGLVLVKAGQYPGTAIHNFGTLTLNHCTVGKSETFCILNNGSLAMNYCRIANNSGGLFMGNQTTINHCTISDNAVSGSAVIDNHGMLAITNSTISGNTASFTGNGRGGAIYNSATLRLSSSTIYNNVCSGGNGGCLHAAAGVSVLIQNTIIAGNRASGPGQDVFGAVITQGYNLIGATNNSTGWSGTDQTGTTNAPLNARLGPLQYNGGSNPTIFTHALLPGSPVWVAKTSSRSK